MLTVYVPGPNGLLPYAPVPGTPVPPEAVWIDLFQPALAEVQRVEQALDLALPTREEMQEIEVSSRLYQEDGALFMTAVVLSQSDTEHPETTAVTFVLKGDYLVTVRHAEPKPFRQFIARASRHSALKRGDQVLNGLLEAVIERAADILERVTTRVDALSMEVFMRSGSATSGKAVKEFRDFQEILSEVGKTGDVASRARESLMSIGRLLAFLGQGLPKHSKDPKAQVKVLWRDVQSLLDHANFVAGKITFLLDATLGMVNIEQNAIIKIFSVVSVVFLPPTLVASMYGMNFKIIPELEWTFGYPWALCLMVVSAVAPFLYFKRKGWL
ncbi:magnesium/cobalt transporter CorA [Novispirillum itersonii]|uniref:Magnesium transport protein CorA n=1 Tax=Novispirillum itersonii TaxID=189 RepID=A0A7W9ZGC5_NOVIT|nr:magnesium/cobalt transporter CorA [Novispirillum itersonii]MBB6210997.1 magnesium transporter [Novispirillum itersonii]